MSDVFWAVGEQKRRKTLEKKLALAKDELKKEVEIEFRREKEVELRQQIYSELKGGIERSKMETTFVPTNELGVVLLFGKYHDYLGYEILDISAISPDCLAEKDGKEVRIEFEFASSNFITHGHNPDDCDLVVCWKKDVELPIEILELSSCLAYFIKNVKRECKTKRRPRKAKWVTIKKAETVEERKAREKKFEELDEVIRQFEQNKS